MLTPFFNKLIDNFGIWQHTDGQKIIEGEGYSLDDAARGLIACLALNKLDKAEILYKYLMNSRHKDGFYGFATKNHTYINYPASEDATGQVIWAMGFASSVGFHKTEATALIDELSPRLRKFQHIRGYAYALLGTLYSDPALSQFLANKILKSFDSATDQWFWPEEVITYGNGIIAYSLLRYAITIQDTSIADFGLKILEFLNNKCRADRLLAPIGNEGWLHINDKTIPTFSQQPIDSAYMVWAWLAASIYYNNEEYDRNSQEWLAWFNGSNVVNAPMFDPLTLKAYDGIDKKGINYHSGAESNICLLLSLYMKTNKITL